MFLIKSYFVTAFFTKNPSIELQRDELKNSDMNLQTPDGIVSNFLRGCWVVGEIVWKVKVEEKKRISLK